MKKNFAFIISAILCTLLLTASVFAESVFTLSSEACSAGDVIDITISLKAQEPINSIGLSYFEYDESVFTFEGFSDYEASLKSNMVFPMSPDENKMALVIPLKTATAFDGVLCTMSFSVNEAAKDGVYTISATPITKNSSETVTASVIDAQVSVTGDSQADIPSEPEKEEPVKPQEKPDTTPEIEFDKPDTDDKEDSEEKNTETPDEKVEENQKPVEEPKDDEKASQEVPEAVIPEWKNPFIDVKENDWFHDAVKYANTNGLMNGTSDVEFAPNASLTRAMFVTVLYRLENQPEITYDAGFTDLEKSSWYEKAVNWAQKNGIVNGYTETEFMPNENITREQIATIMYRYAKYKVYDVSASAEIGGYADFASISPYAVQPIQYSVGNGIMTGKTDITFNPQDKATRAEMAVVLQRFIEKTK